MTNEEAEARILQTISSVLGISVADLGHEVAMYRTPGWDSLAMLEIVSAIEYEFDVRIDDDQMAACTNLESLTTLLAEMNGRTK